MWPKICAPRVGRVFLQFSLVQSVQGGVEYPVIIILSAIQLVKETCHHTAGFDGCLKTVPDLSVLIGGGHTVSWLSNPLFRLPRELQLLSDTRASLSIRGYGCVAWDTPQMTLYSCPLPTRIDPTMPTQSSSTMCSLIVSLFAAVLAELSLKIPSM